MSTPPLPASAPPAARRESFARRAESLIEQVIFYNAKVETLFNNSKGVAIEL